VRRWYSRKPKAGLYFDAIPSRGPEVHFARTRYAASKKRPPSPEAFSLSNRVLGGLDRPGPHDLACRLGLEHHFFAREGVGALARLGRGLLDHDELGEAGDEEHPVLLQLLVADVNERIHHALDFLLRNFGGRSDLFDQLRLRHLGSHVCSI